MTEKEIIMSAMKSHNFNQVELGEKAGYKSKSAITEILNRKGMKVEIFLKLLYAMNCKVIVKSETTGEEWLLSGSK